jgi:hypothetical protein
MRVFVFGDVIGALQQCEIGLGMKLPMHSGERLEYLPDRARSLRSDPPGKPGPNPPSRRRQPLRNRGGV